MIIGSPISLPILDYMASFRINAELMYPHELQYFIVTFIFLINLYKTKKYLSYLLKLLIIYSFFNLKISLLNESFMI